MKNLTIENIRELADRVGPQVLNTVGLDVSYNAECCRMDVVVSSKTKAVRLQFDSDIPLVDALETAITLFYPEKFCPAPVKEKPLTKQQLREQERQRNHAAYDPNELPTKASGMVETMVKTVSKNSTPEEPPMMTAPEPVEDPVEPTVAAPPVEEQPQASEPTVTPERTCQTCAFDTQCSEQAGPNGDATKCTTYMPLLSEPTSVDSSESTESEEQEQSYEDDEQAEAHWATEDVGSDDSTDQEDPNEDAPEAQDDDVTDESEQVEDAAQESEEETQPDPMQEVHELSAQVSDLAKSESIVTSDEEASAPGDGLPVCTVCNRPMTKEMAEMCAKQGVPLRHNNCW